MHDSRKSTSQSTRPDAWRNKAAPELVLFLLQAGAQPDSCGSDGAVPAGPGLADWGT